MSFFRVYLCSRFSRHPEMREVAERLRAVGVTVTSRWISGDHDLGVTAITDEEGTRLAVEDFEDLERSDAVFVFTEEPNPGGRNRGGRHVEFGMALGLGLDVYVIGPRENVFHYLPGVVCCSLEEAIGAVSQGFARLKRVVKAKLVSSTLPTGAGGPAAGLWDVELTCGHQRFVELLEDRKPLEARVSCGECERRAAAR